VVALLHGNILPMLSDGRQPKRRGTLPRRVFPGAGPEAEFISAPAKGARN
jgi:hypothetical protein